MRREISPDTVKRLLEKPETETNMRELKNVLSSGFNPNQTINTNRSDLLEYRENLLSYAIHLRKYKFIKLLDMYAARVPERYVNLSEIELDIDEDGREEHIDITYDDRIAYKKYLQIKETTSKEKERRRRRRALTERTLREHTKNIVIPKLVTSYLGGMKQKYKKKRKTIKKHKKPVIKRRSRCEIRKNSNSKTRKTRKIH